MEKGLYIVEYEHYGDTKRDWFVDEKVKTYDEQIEMAMDYLTDYFEAESLEIILIYEIAETVIQDAYDSYFN